MNYLKGNHEERFVPYVGAGAGALGAAAEPFDLNDPAIVAEVKQALVALAKADSDPFRNPQDPIRETTWRQIQLDGPWKDAWDGPTADEFAMAMSRYAIRGTNHYGGLTGPWLQVGGSGFGAGIVGGPQPSAHGLEVLAGAVRERLGGQPVMARYLAWRGGMIEPPSSYSGPDANAPVTPNRRHGQPWQPTGYTLAYPEGDAAAVAEAARADAQLLDCWNKLSLADSEAHRELVMTECVLPWRRAHHEAALVANRSVPAPACPEGQRYDPAEGRCRLPGVIENPNVDVELSEEACLRFYRSQGMTDAQARAQCGVEGGLLERVGLPGVLAVGAAVGLGVYWWQRKRTTRRSA